MIAWWPSLLAWYFSTVQIILSQSFISLFSVEMQACYIMIQHEFCIWFQSSEKQISWINWFIYVTLLLFNGAQANQTTWYLTKQGFIKQTEKSDTWIYSQLLLTHCTKHSIYRPSDMCKTIDLIFSTVWINKHITLLWHYKIV